MLACEIIVIVGVLVLQTISVLVPSATLRLVAFGSRKGLCWCANMDGGTRNVVFSFRHNILLL